MKEADLSRYHVLNHNRGHIGFSYLLKANDLERLMQVEVVDFAFIDFNLLHFIALLNSIDVFVNYVESHEQMTIRQHDITFKVVDHLVRCPLDNLVREHLANALI